MVGEAELLFGRISEINIQNIYLLLVFGVKRLNMGLMNWCVHYYCCNTGRSQGPGTCQ